MFPFDGLCIRHLILDSESIAVHPMILQYKVGERTAAKIRRRIISSCRKFAKTRTLLKINDTKGALCVNVMPLDEEVYGSQSANVIVGVSA